MQPSREKIAHADRRYGKLVEWSDEDQCCIGSAPQLVGQSCHGPNEVTVLAESSAYSSGQPSCLCRVRGCGRPRHEVKKSNLARTENARIKEASEGRR